jgi:hypothetical protein
MVPDPLNPNTAERCSVLDDGVTSPLESESRER